MEAISTLFLVFRRDHLRSTSGIICGTGSFVACQRKILALSGVFFFLLLLFRLEKDGRKTLIYFYGNDAQ